MKKIILLATVFLALAACNNEDNFINEPTEARISATIGKSRASGTKWDAGDNIGITMGDWYANMEYTTTGDGMFTGTPMYFKNTTDKVKFTAYYPFAGTEGTAAGTISYSTKAENQTAAKQPEFDFLFALKEDITGKDPQVTLTFSHMMSKITLIFNNGDGADVSKITSYAIEGLVLEGTFNTQTGDCAVNNATTAQIISMTTSGVQSMVELPSLIVFPQTVTAVKLKVSDSEGQDYECPLTFEGNRLESGNNYQFTVRVNKAGLIVDLLTITDWNTKSVTTDADAV